GRRGARAARRARSTRRATARREPGHRGLELRHLAQQRAVLELQVLDLTLASGELGLQLVGGEAQHRVRRAPALAVGLRGAWARAAAARARPHLAGLALAPVARAQSGAVPARLDDDRLGRRRVVRVGHGGAPAMGRTLYIARHANCDGSNDT